MQYSSLSGTGGFTGVYVFGDSLVDPGNALKAAEFIDDIPFVGLPDGAPTADKGYFEGRFTDGYNFADLISNKLILTPTKATFPYGFEDPVLGLPLFPFASRPSGNNLSFAYGGAQVRQGGEIVPDLDDQTDIYRNYPAADPNALYIVTIGGNDVRAMVPRDEAPLTGAAATARLVDVADEIGEEVRQLFQFGARHILLSGIPDVGLIPHYTGSVDEAARRSLATQYSHQLEDLVQGEIDNLIAPAGAKLYGFDFSGFSDAIFADPAAFRLTNLTQPRMTVQQGALAAVGAGFLFFDSVHPSAQAHALAADDILHGPQAPVPVAAAPKWFAAVEASGGSDGYTASLVAGRIYVFDLMGISSGSGSLADPKLRVLDASGAVVAEDDDAGVGLDARLSFVAPATGTYTLQASAIGVATGSYVLQGSDLRGSNVTVQGGALNDTITAVSGSNVLRGGSGNDSLLGGSGVDDIGGEAGSDTGRGGGGNDLLAGGDGDDRLYGDTGQDTVQGNAGVDNCEGGLGADVIRGGQGDDVIRGLDGADWLAGDKGSDTLTGGAGADTFHTNGGAGLDWVTDFNNALGDRVNVLPGTQWTASQVGADAVIDMVGGGRMVLAGVQLSSLTGDWIY